MKFKNSKTNYIFESVSTIKETGNFVTKNIEIAFRKSQDFVSKKENRKKVFAILGIVSCGTLFATYTTAVCNKKKIL